MVRRLSRFDASLWRRTAALGAVVVLGLPFTALWLGPSPWLLKVWAAALVILGAARPRWGLLLVAGLAPLATPFAIAIGAPFGGPQMIEAMTVPFVIGFALRTVMSRAPTHAPLALPAAALGMLILIGGLIQLIALQETSAWAAEYYPALWRHLVTDYFADPATFVPAHLALVWIAGLGLATAASIVVAESDDVKRGVVNVLLFGAAAAACLALQRLVEISARTPEPWHAALRFAISERINPHFPDLNAAGSYYAIFAVAAAWLTIRTRSAVAMATLPFVVFGLWISGSRTALAAAVVGLGVLIARSRRWRALPLAIGAAVIVGAAWIVMMNPGRQQAEPGEALTVRAELTRVSLRLAKRDPLFGLGLGEFQRASESEIDPALIKLFPPAARGENAHNNFLQILVELGVLGLTGFLWLPAIALGLAARTGTAAPGPTTRSIEAMAGGTIAFLVTCVAGHPLLSPQVLIAFLLAVGISVGLTGVQPPRGSRRRAGIAVGLVLLFAAIAAPWRIDRQVAAMTSDGASIGVSPAAGELDGVRYRLIEDHARFWLPAGTQVVELPLRLPEGVSCDVAFDVNGRRANVVRPTADNWNVVRLPLGPGSAGRARRLDVSSTAPGCRLLVGPVSRRD